MLKFGFVLVWEKVGIGLISLRMISAFFIEVLSRYKKISLLTRLVSSDFDRSKMNLIVQRPNMHLKHSLFLKCTMSLNALFYPFFFSVKKLSLLSFLLHQLIYIY